MMKRILPLLAAILLLSACRSPMPPAKPAPPDKTESTAPQDPNSPVSATALDEQYRVWLNFENRWVFDRDGNEIPKDKQFTVLRDILTGEPQCKVLTRMEDTGERNEYGGVIARHLSQLYDTDGKLLINWEETTYQPGFGDFVIRQDSLYGIVDIDEVPKDYKSCLFNFKTGQTVVDGAANIIPVDEDANTLLLSEFFGLMLCVIDQTGNRLADLPAEKYYSPQNWHGYILASTRTGNGEYYEQDETVLLSKEFKPLLRGQSFNANFYGLRGAFLIRRDNIGPDETNTILSAPDGKEIFQSEPGESIDYFDGELVVLQTNIEDDEQNPWRYNLKKADGTVLADGFTYLTACNESNDNNLPATFFLAVDGDRVLKLDRQGNTLVSAELPGVTRLEFLGNERFSYSVPDQNVEWQQFCGLLDKDLRILQPAQRYRNIFQLTRWENGRIDFPLLQCSYQKGNLYIVDIADMDGNIVIENLNNVNDVGDNRLSVVKGFSAGLMDWKGNWIAKRSIFADLAID